jgi:hypothetical protein
MQFQATPEPTSVPGLEPMPEATVAPEITPEPIPMAIPMEAPAAEPADSPEPKPSTREEEVLALRRTLAEFWSASAPTSTTHQAEPLEFQTSPQPDAEAETHPEWSFEEQHESALTPELIGEPDESDLVPTEAEMIGTSETIPVELTPKIAETEGVALKKPAHELRPNDAKAPATDTQRANRNEAHPKYDWVDAQSGPPPGSRLGWLVENVPRKMRAHIPVEAEVRVSSSMSPGLVSNLVGQGQTDIDEIEIAQAMSLRLSAPRGGFEIEPQSPETQWVWKDKEAQSDNDLAAWRFTLTPTRRGANTLRLTFSYKEVGPDGLIADSALPDKVLDIAVGTNVRKFCAQAAVWGVTLVVGAALGAYFQGAALGAYFQGAALGAYFQPLVRMLGELYR